MSRPARNVFVGNYLPVLYNLTQAPVLGHSADLSVLEVEKLANRWPREARNNNKKKKNFQMTRNKYAVNPR
jgi:hypothetical protein